MNIEIVVTAIGLFSAGMLIGSVLRGIFEARERSREYIRALTLSRASYDEGYRLGKIHERERPRWGHK